MRRGRAWMTYVMVAAMAAGLALVGLGAWLAMQPVEVLP